MIQQKLLLGIALGVVGSLSLVTEGKSAGVQITELPDRLRVEINGKLFTEYFFTGKSHPWISSSKNASGVPQLATNLPKHVYFYPLLGPDGVPMTRNWPMKDTPGEEHDHPHHRSLWYSHGAVNGVDFWGEGEKSGQIVHDRFLEVKSGSEMGVIRSRNKWIAPDGQVPLTDEQTFRVYARPNTERLFDFDVTLKAGDMEVILGDTKEGSMAVRLNEDLRLSHGKGKPGTGHIIQSTGVRDDSTWGKRADWCDYYGPLEGKVVGLAIFDHPRNPKHPTWWHVRDYGLFAANPFGAHEFEKQPSGAGNLKLAPGQSITFRYRFYLHEGDEKQANVAERYQQYVDGGQ
jgi:hypothetical protein